MITWLDAIDANGFDGWTRTMLVAEAQRTRFPGDLPAGFAFLSGGFVDLGFENLGLAAAELKAVRLAFVGIGVRVPVTNYRLRNVGPGRSVVEPASGDEPVHFPTAGGNASWCSPQTRATPEVASRGLAACLGRPRRLILHISHHLFQLLKTPGQREKMRRG